MSNSISALNSSTSEDVSSSELSVTNEKTTPAPETKFRPSLSSMKSIPNRSHFIRPVPKLIGSNRMKINSDESSEKNAVSKEDSRKDATISDSNETKPESTAQATENNINIISNTGTCKLPFKPRKRFVISESARKMAEKRHESESKIQDVDNSIPPTINSPAPPVDCVPPTIPSESSEAVDPLESEPSVLPPEPSIIDKITSPTAEHIKTVLPLSANENPSISLIKSVPSRSCFIRPVPRLDGHRRIRRNSVQGSGASASESEDDSRRDATINSNQTKLESTPLSTENQCNNNNNNTATSKGPLKQKKRFVISESARKMAEKRREFQLKHENQLPDRAKLTMYDLIYYNPETNPMKKNTDSKPPPRRVERPIELPSEDEGADDPTDVAMPVPQVKVGPDGQLIIDEQSLVIENTGVKKNREALARQEAEQDDNNYGSGFYKRRQRSKDWPNVETIKFYKALNTVGTDFLLMQSLFPHRTREELKLKFKKEERVNGNLVEKALKNHQEYNIDALQQELKSCEKADNSTAAPDSNAKEPHDKTKQRKRGKYRRVAATSIDQHGESDGRPRKRRIKSPKRNRVKKVACTKKKPSVSDDHSTSEELSATESVKDHEGTSEIYKPRATRSGRKPRAKKISINAEKVLENIYDSDDNIVVKHDTVIEEAAETSLEKIKDSIKDIGAVEPGSLVIVSKESPDEPGKTIFQVYMISSELNNGHTNLPQAMTPVDLSSEMLAMVTSELHQAPVDDIFGE